VLLGESRGSAETHMAEIWTDEVVADTSPIPCD
jgi:hypothetical protein